MPLRNCHKLTKTLIENYNLDSVVWDREVPGFGLRATLAGTRSFVEQLACRHRDMTGALVRKNRTVSRLECLASRLER